MCPAVRQTLAALQSLQILTFVEKVQALFFKLFYFYFIFRFVSRRSMQVTFDHPNSLNVF